MTRHLLLALFLALPAHAAEQHITATNQVTATSSPTGACTALGEPWGGCTGPGTGWSELNTYDGADIVAAMRQCTGTLKCVIDLVPGATYENVAVDIDGFSPPSIDRAHGRNGGGFNGSSFANGLLIDGHGAILKSRIPLSAKPNYKAAVFEVDQQVFTVTNLGIEFRDFECDGQSDKQPSPKDAAAAGWSDQTTGESLPTHMPPPYDAMYERRYNTIESFHMCIHFWHGGAYPVSGKQIVRNLHVHHFISTGIALVGGSQMIVTDSLVHDIGSNHGMSNALCHGLNDPDWYGFGCKVGTCVAPTSFWGTGLPQGAAPTCCTGPGTGTCDTFWKTKVLAGSPAVGSMKLGGGPGSAYATSWDDYYDWNPASNASPGYKSNTGFGITIETNAGASRALVARNVVYHVAKYGIDSASYDMSASGSGLPVGDNHTYISYNKAYSNTISYMAGTFVTNTTFLRNECGDATNVGAGLEGNISNSVECFGAQGDQAYVGLIQNHVFSSNDSAIHLGGYMKAPGFHPGVEIRGNIIESSGIWNPTGTPPGGYRAAVHAFTNQACPGDLRYENPMEIWILDNEIYGSNKNNMALNLGDQRGGQSCNANRIDPLIISGANKFGPSGWSTHGDDIAEILAYNIQASGVTLLKGTAASQFRFLAGSTGACSGFTASSAAPALGTATASVLNSSSVTGGTCGAP